MAPLKKITSVNELRAEQENINEYAIDPRKEYTAKVLLGLNALDTHHGPELVAALETQIGFPRLLDILYLAAVYGVRGAETEEDKNVEDSAWEVIWKEFVAAWYSDAERDLILPLIATYIGSSENRERIVEWWLTQSTVLVQSPHSYVTGMHAIYKRAFPGLEAIDGAEKREWGHILGYNFPDKLTNVLEELSDEIGGICTNYDIGFVPYDVSTLHSTIGVIRTSKENMQDVARKNETPILLEYDEEVEVPAPMFKNLGLKVSKDTLVLGASPIGSAHLDNLKKHALATPWLMGSALSHITIGRFVGEPTNEDAVKEINEVIQQYTTRLKNEFPTILPSGMFTGTFDLNTIGGFEQRDQATMPEVPPYFVLEKRDSMFFGDNYR